MRYLRPLFAGVGYFLLAELSYALIIQPASIVIWLPAGLLLGTLLLTNRWEWPPLLVAAFLGNVGADLHHGQAIGLALGGGLANMLETGVAAIFMRRVAGPHIYLSSRRDIGTLLGAVVGTNALTALVGMEIIAKGLPAHPAHDWFVWWAGDGLGMLIITPIVLTWGDPRPVFTWTIARRIEAALMLGATVFVSWHVLGAEEQVWDVFGGLRYLTFPLLLLMAMRVGPWGAATSIGLLTGVVLWRASHGALVFVTPGISRLGVVSEIFAYLAVASLSGLIPAVEWSERQHAEAQLRSSETRFRQMAEHIEDAFFTVDLSTGGALYISPTWSTIWGRPIAEGYDPKIWLEAIHPDDRDQMTQSIKTVRAGGTDSITVRIVRPDGTTRWVRSRTFPVRDDRGVPYRLVGVTTDITDMRNAEERLLLSQKMEALGRLAGGVAHDFNNLLTVIIADGELLAARLKGRENLEQVEEIRAAANRAAGLTRQLLAFSRRQVIESTVFDLNELVAEAIGLLQRLIGENIMLLAVPLDQRCSVRAHRGQIEQVITNLAINARDAMPRGGHLSIKTAIVDLDEAFVQSRDEVQPGRYVVLSVSDTGSGMSEAVRARVFEPFFTTKPQGEGTGLGLATSYGIVKKAGGHLTVYTEVGKGTTFRMYLPMVAHEVTKPAPAGDPTARGGSETILLVEDEPSVRRVALRLLGSFGYTVFEAADGKEALTILREHAGDIDLLLTDMMLPEMGGRELAEIVHQEQPHIRILFTSGYTEDAILHHQLLEKGASLLGKPFTRDELAEKVRLALDGSNPDGSALA